MGAGVRPAGKGEERTGTARGWGGAEEGGGTEGKKEGRLGGLGRRLDTEGKNAAAEVFRARKGLEIFTVVNSGCFAMA